MVYIFLAEGFEEIEALTQIDLLKRAEIPVTSVGIGGCMITGSHGISVKCDTDIESVSICDTEMLILPGGMPGVTNLLKSQKLCDVVLKEAEKGTYIAAICAAPMILGRLGLSDNRKMTCYPGFENELSGAYVSDEPVVADGNIITGKAAGAALDFAYKLIEALKGKAVSDKVFGGIYYDR